MKFFPTPKNYFNRHNFRAIEFSEVKLAYLIFWATHKHTHIDKLVLYAERAYSDNTLEYRHSFVFYVANY